MRCVGTSLRVILKTNVLASIQTGAEGTREEQNLYLQLFARYLDFFFPLSPTAPANDKHTDDNAAGPVASHSFLRVPLSPFRGKSGIFPLVFRIV